MARIQVSNDPSGRIIVSFPYDALLVEKVNPAVALEGLLGAPPTPYPAVHNCWIYQAVFYYALCNGWVKTIDGRRWHPAEKHWSFLKLEGMLEKILKVFGDENIQIDPSLQANLPKTSSREDEAKQELFQFEDLRRELVSRKYSYKTLTKMSLRSSRKIGTHFGQRLAAERKASAEHQTKVSLPTGGFPAKRHFGQQTGKRLKPKCPKGHFAHPPAVS